MRVPFEARWRVLLLTVVLMASACSGPKTEGRDNYDPDTDWSEVKTFVWFGIQAQRGYNEFNVKRLANAIRDELQDKGLEIVGDRMLADVGVVAYLGVLPKAVDAWKRTDGFLWTKDKELITAGTLVVEIIDLNKGGVIWVGTAERQLEANPTQDQTRRNIKDVVRKLFAAFPPS